MAQATKTEAMLRAREETFTATDPERAAVIARARAFKASWMELAAVLTEVRRTRRHEAWGYSTFDDYVRRELAITPQTADKLTGSYAFLATRAPDLARRARRPSLEDADVVAAREADEEAVARLPSYQAVDFWRRAEEAGAADEETLGALGEAVLAGATPAQLSRRFAPRAFPVAPSEKRLQSRKAVLVAAHRLADSLVDCPDVPRALCKQLESMLGELIASLEPGAPR